MRLMPLFEKMYVIVVVDEFFVAKLDDHLQTVFIYLRRETAQTDFMSTHKESLRQ